jgi:hypothetical protein
MPTAEVETEDGETVEVDLNDAAPDGYRVMSDEELNERYVDKEYHEKEVQRVQDRFDSNMRSDIREELKNDEEFRQEVAAEVGMDEEERKQLVQEVEEKKVQPLKKELEKRKRQAKRQAVLSEARQREDIDPKALQQVGDADPLVLQALESRVEEADDGRYVVTDGNGNPLPSDDGGYAGIGEGLDKLKESDDFQPLFQEPEPTSGSGFEESGSSGPSAERAADMSDEELMDYVREHGSAPGT